MCQYPRPGEDQRPGLDGNLPTPRPISSPPPGIEPGVALPEVPIQPLVEALIDQGYQHTVVSAGSQDSPVVLARDSRTAVEVAVVAEQDRRVFEAIDQPDQPKVNGNGHKARRLCPGPGCRKVPRRESPYCSKICSDRCYRLRMKSARALLTDQEVIHLNRILQALDGRTAA